jgi:hypothetical protein
LVISAAFALGVYYFYDLRSDFEYQQAEIEFLQSEIRQHERLERMYTEQEEKVAALQELWEDIEAAGLTPEKWRSYTLSVSRNLNWQQLERVMRLASNEFEGQNGYWFRPDRLRVSRVVEKATEGEEQGLALTAEQDGVEEQVEMFYQTTMTGKFLLPKQRQ